MAALTSQVELATKTQEQAARRSEIYQLLSSIFRFPTHEIFEGVKSRKIWDRLQFVAPELPYSLTIAQIQDNSGLNFEEFQSLYIRLFEVGQGIAPVCPLYEGHYKGMHSSMMAELLAFYHYFGVGLNQHGPRELPDHLSIELEFLHVLTYKEAIASREDGKVTPYLKAERDFLERHLLEFVTAMGKRLIQDKALFFSDALALAEQFCHSDLAYVTGRLRS